MERVIVIAVFICMMMTALLIAHAVVFTVLGEKCVWLIKVTGIFQRRNRISMIRALL